MPLFAAVLHGCQAGKHQEVLDEVYRQRIARTNEYFSVKKLGAIGADLSALSGFFDYHGVNLLQDCAKITRVLS